MRIPRRLFRLRRGRNPEFRLGNRARDRRRWREAAGHYAKALAVEPERVAIWVQYGHALKETGDLAGSERAYRRALALAPELADTHLQLGHALKLQGRIDEAAAAYVEALTCDPHLHFAALELFNLGRPLGGGNDAASGRIAAAVRRKYASSDRAFSASSRRSVVLDVSDLIDYFQHARIPTGIQRVQINVVASLLRASKRDCDLLVASVSLHGDGWTLIPEALFLRLADLAIAAGEIDEPVWRDVARDLFFVLAAGEIAAFPEGAVLVTMGGTPSARLQNHLLLVQSAKRRRGVRYIPFVHDCIPLLAARFCSEELTRDFIGWLVGALWQADGFLVNSQATAIDLTTAARLLGRPAPAPAVVRLDACFSSAIGTGHEAPADGEEAIGRHRPDRRDFVLFVSTIEARKNHLLAFAAWRSLIRKRGLRRTPLLVCVGKQGWSAEPAMACLAASRRLRRKVLILSKVSDAELASLYRRSLFTLYPSAYEGWGLPVTESFCYGKVPLITRATSLPEAGGDLAEYFDPGAAGDLLAKLERLIDDDAYRRAREARIRQDFAARTWRDIAEDIVAGAFAQARAAHDPNRLEPVERRGISPLPVEIGRYYAVARNRETGVWPGMICGAMYRVGHGWWPPSEWGTWLKGAEAELAFSLVEPADGIHLVYLGLRGTPENAADYRVRVGGGEASESGTLAAAEERWVALTLTPEIVREGAVHITLSTTGHCVLGKAANGYRHIVTLGVVGFYVCRQRDAHAR